MTMDLSPTAASAGPLLDRITKLEKINQALMGRVERSMDVSGSAFSLFQTAILLEDKVKARTQDLERTLDTLSDAYARLRDARDDAEMAKQNLTAAIEAVTEGFALFDSDERLVMCNAPFRMLMPDIAESLKPGARFENIAQAFSESSGLVTESGLSREDWRRRRIETFRKPYSSFIQQFTGDKWLQVSNRKMTSGATVIFQTDITDTVRNERERHERELDEQAKILRATIDHLPQGICMFSANLQLKAWNRSFINLLSMPVKLLTPHVSMPRILKAIRTAQFAIGAEAAKSLDAWLENPSVHVLSDVEIRRSDGAILSVSSSVMPGGGFVVTFTDVTRERQATLALKEANETLEQRVEERTLALRREVMERREIETQLLLAKEQAEDANKSKTRFLAAASHDLLQPLNASRIFLSLLQETGLNARQSRFATVADRAFVSVEQLLETLLDISRFDAGGVEPHMTVFRLDDMLNTLVAEFVPVSERQGLRLRYVPTTVWVRSDQALLRRIIQNFLSNAIRYTQKGHVLVGVRRRGRQIAIEVLDTGPGIPLDKQALVFEEFRRLQHPQGEHKAMGLGLAIVDRIAALLDHKVKLVSAPGRGSRFAVEVDVAEAPSERPRNEAEQARRPRTQIARKTVMMIENDLQILEGMVELLESRGLQVIPTVSVEEAMEALETLERLPNILLADYHLDNGTGLDAIRAIRKMAGSNIAAIMITADHSAPLRGELAREDIHFLGKPLKPNILFERIAELTS